MRRGPTYTIFTNGVRPATTTKTASSADNAQHLLFGRNNDPASTARYSVRIYGRALTDCEAWVLGAR